MSSNSIEQLNHEYLVAIESALKQAVLRANEFGSSGLYDMLAYHMGWNVGSEAASLPGKRLRPLLVLLTCSAAGGGWQSALPGATAVELVHNFSLIHDDIEDNSPLRRGRPTVWKKWGMPQAINAGDAMFALAHLEASHLAETVNPAVGLKAVEIMQSTCLHLTQGQHLDLSYETRPDLQVDDYWTMVEGKTAALIAASTELGALCALCDDDTCEKYRQFGRLLGLAFQVQDDLLGIWGDSLVTGKSSQSDLETGKITLPVLYGLSRLGKFAKRWKDGPISSSDLPEMTRILEDEGAKDFTLEQSVKLLDEALSVLRSARPGAIASTALVSLANSMAYRQA